MSNQRSHTKQLVQDYIAWRLAKNGYPLWHHANKIDLKSNTQNKLCTAMRHLAYKFEHVYECEFSNKLQISNFNCRDTFMALVVDLFELPESNGIPRTGEGDGLLSDGSYSFSCNWGRIIAMLSFAGSLAIQLYENKLTSLIYAVIDIQLEILNDEQRIFNWIESQGGWNAFLEYFNERYNLIKLENIDLPIENLNNAITRNNYFFKFHDDSSSSPIDSILYLDSIQAQCKSIFERLTSYTGVAVGSISMLALGAVYMKRKR